MADFPHFSMPFRFERWRDGSVVVPVSEQNSLAEVGDCVELALRTEQGERRTLPEFGRPESLAFTVDRELISAQVQQTIDDAEPRVSALVERDDLDPDDPGLVRILAMYELMTEEEAGTEPETALVEEGYE